MNALPLKIAAAIGCGLVMGAVRAQAVSGTVTTRVVSADLTTSSDDNQSFNNETVATAVTPTTITASSALPGYGSADAAITASLGALKASSSASFNSPDPSYSGDAQGLTEINASDTGVITWAGHATGTPVSFQLVLNYDGTHSVPDFQSGGSVDVEAVLYMNAVDNTAGAPSSPSTYLQHDSKGTAGTDAGKLTSILNTRVGDTVTLTYGLSTIAYIGNQATVTHSGSADYSHTVLPRFVSLTPGAQFMAASGFDYAAPVPEPREGAMVAAGVVWCLGGWGLHRRRQR